MDLGTVDLGVELSERFEIRPGIENQTLTQTPLAIRHDMHIKSDGVVKTQSTDLGGNVNPFSRIDKARTAHLLARIGMSTKQAAWLSEVLPLAPTVFEAAVAFVIADKAGVDMGPFDATDEELAREARDLVQLGALFAWSPEGEVRQ